MIVIHVMHVNDLRVCDCICRVDPDRDGLLLKQYEYGLAKQRLSRLECYQRYLPNLSAREKRLLEFEKAPQLKAVAEQVFALKLLPSTINPNGGTWSITCICESVYCTCALLHLRCRAQG